MGNRKRAGHGGTASTERPVSNVSASPEMPAALPAGQHGNGDSPSPWFDDADLDAHIQELVDAAPPLTGEQRDTLALLLRRPHRR